MDISAQIKKLAESRQSLEDQVKSLKGEIRDINVKIRKLETIARHAEEVLSVSDGPVLGTLPEVLEAALKNTYGGLVVPRETTSNGSSEG